jgi:hypothetical protein
LESLGEGCLECIVGSEMDHAVVLKLGAPQMLPKQSLESSPQRNEPFQMSFGLKIEDLKFRDHACVEVLKQNVRTALLYDNFNFEAFSREPDLPVDY